MKPFRLKSLLPKHRAFAALRDQIIDHLMAERPATGERFDSVRELTLATNLSHMTVRRALENLHREGWLECRPGQGTFVGHRIQMPVVPKRHTPQAGRSLLRLGMLSFMHTKGLPPYTRWILEGIEDAAADQLISVEPLSSKLDDLAQKTIRQRLSQSRPDVLACVSPLDAPPYTIGDARLMGIPCLAVGPHVPRMDMPNIYPDTDSAMELAVQHLVEYGHQRIALVLATEPYRYVFDRRKGFLRAMSESGLSAEEDLIHWVDLWEDRDAESTRLLQFLKRRSPTAAVFGLDETLPLVYPLLERGALTIPDDLSIVTSTLPSACQDRLGLMPTYLDTPWVEIGKQTAILARQIVDGLEAPREIALQCRLIKGDSVRACERINRPTSASFSGPKPTS